jgi:steroid delta-isomerase-like uncharacterized protein
MTETTRQIITAFVKNPTAVVLAEEVVLEDHAQNRICRGRAEVESVLRAFFVEGFPEVRTEVHSITADETFAVLECAFHGRQDGPFVGLPSTGREVALPIVIVCQILESQIHRLSLYYDAGSLLRQLGLAL